MIVQINSVHTKEGRVSPRDLAETSRLLQQDQQASALLALSNPERASLQSLTQDFDFSQAAVADCFKDQQRSKIKRYGSTYLVLLRPAVYLDGPEKVCFSQLHLLIKPQCVLAISQDKPQQPAQLRVLLNNIFTAMDRCTSVWSMLHQALQTLLEDYSPVVEGLENDADQIEDSLFESTNLDSTGVSERTYRLLKEVSDFRQACKPLLAIIELVISTISSSQDQQSSQEFPETNAPGKFRDLHGQTLHLVERLDDLQASLHSALEVNSIIVAEQQNDQMKKVSAWAAIMVAPTIIGSIYGMNFERMPELHWTFGYPASLLLILLTSGTLYRIFKKKDWV